MYMRYASKRGWYPKRTTLEFQENHRWYPKRTTGWFSKSTHKKQVTNKQLNKGGRVPRTTQTLEGN